jgi:hypothetical protein
MLRFLMAGLLILSMTAQAQAAGSSAPRPVMVGPGVLSTPDDELNSAFTPDGRTVYFSKNLGDRIGVILVSHWSGKWGTPRLQRFPDGSATMTRS